jgi:peptidyl-prolyl cis-trans isomerase SurA
MTPRCSLSLLLLVLLAAAACDADGRGASESGRGEGSHASGVLERAREPREQARSSRQQRMAEVVALVAGEPVLGAEIEPAGQIPREPAKLADARRRYLENVIDERVLRLELERLKLRLTPAEVAEAHAGDPPASEMAAFLTRLGKTREEYSREVEERRLLQKLREQEVGGRLLVTEEEIRAEFHAHRERYPRLAGAHLRQLFRPLGAGAAEDEAARERHRLRDEVMRQLAGRGSSRLAEEFGDELGLLTYELGVHGFGEGILAHSALREAVARLEPGGISPILRSPEGLHVFYVVDRQEAGRGTLEEARTRVERALRQRKYRQGLEQWMRGLWERYDVQLLLESGSKGVAGTDSR